MNERPDAVDAGDEPDGNTISPLPGEPGIPHVAVRRRISMSKKGLLAVALLILGLVAVAAFSIQRFSASGKKAGDAESKLASDRPTAATIEPRKLEMPPPAASAPAAQVPRIPALVPTAEEAEPIGVRRTGQGAPAGGGARAQLPEDAPVLLVSTRPGAAAPGVSATRRTDPATPAGGAEQGPDGNPNDPNEAFDPLAATTRNLQGYQRHLQGMLDTLTKSTANAAGQATGPIGGASIGMPSAGGPTMGGSPSSGGGLFGGQMQGTATPRIAATMLGNRSLTMPKGTAFTCALKTKIISAASGLVGCQVQRNVYSDDGRVLLIERGSHMDGEYRITSVRPGTVRIPVLWTRIRTPNGVTVDIESPGTGQLGESGVDGYVDNRWMERLGAAMLVSLINDSVQLIIQSQASPSDNIGQTNTILLPATTANASKLAEKVLDSTINIPPLIYQNQGGIVGIYVARDVDFSSVYELQPTSGHPAR